MITIEGQRPSRAGARWARAAAAALVVAVAWPGTVRAQTSLPSVAPPIAGAKAYVALYDEGGVEFFDTRTQRLLGYFGGVIDPQGLVATPDGRTVYVGSDVLPTVSAIDTLHNRIAAAVDVGTGQRGLALSPTGSELLVSVWASNEVVAVDTTRNRVIARVPVSRPERSVITPDGRRAYVVSADLAAPGLVVIDLATHRGVGRIPMADAPLEVNVDPVGRRLYATMAGGEDVVVVDLAHDRVEARIPVDAGLRDPLPGPDGTSMVVLSQAHGTLDVIDVARGVVRARIPVGTDPRWIALNQSTQTAYVTNAASDDVSVVDLRRGTTVGTVPIGRMPVEILLVQPPDGAVAQRTVG